MPGSPASRLVAGKENPKRRGVLESGGAAGAGRPATGAAPRAARGPRQARLLTKCWQTRGRPRGATPYKEPLPSLCTPQGSLKPAAGGMLELVAADITQRKTLLPSMFQGVGARRTPGHGRLRPCARAGTHSPARPQRVRLPAGRCTPCGASLRWQMRVRSRGATMRALDPNPALTLCAAGASAGELQRGQGSAQGGGHR